MIMAVQVGPNGRIGIEIFPAFHIAQHRPLPFHNHNRFALEPIAHLRERMPEITVIQLSEEMHSIYNWLSAICYWLFSPPTPPASRPTHERPLHRAPP